MSPRRSKRLTCPDEGMCHHLCARSCWRVGTCAPLSGVFPDNLWPAEVIVKHSLTAPQRRVLRLLGREVAMGETILCEAHCYEGPDWTNPRQALHSCDRAGLVTFNGWLDEGAGCELKLTPKGARVARHLAEVPR